MSEASTTQLQALINRLNSGDSSARAELIAYASDRLRRLARKMLRDFTRVRSFEETDDVLQNLSLRLMRRLEAVEIPTVAEFFSLAARETRRELLDLARRYAGGAQALGGEQSSDSSGKPLDGGEPDTTDRPDRLAVLTEIHKRVETLPDDERAVFDLLWYEGLSQVEAATTLQVSRAAVQRAWLSARLRLQEFLQDNSIN